MILLAAAIRKAPLASVWAFDKLAKCHGAANRATKGVTIISAERFTSTQLCQKS
jgi:hypothetical protein